MGKCALEVLALQADFGEISGVKKVSVSRQDRRKSRMDAIEGAIRNMGDILSGYLTTAVNMFPMDGNTEREKMLKELKEIGKLNWGAESRLGAEQEIEELKARIAMSGKNTEKKN